MKRIIEFQKNGSPQEIYLFEILKRYNCSILVKLDILREKKFPGRYFLRENILNLALICKIKLRELYQIHRFMKVSSVIVKFSSKKKLKSHTIKGRI